MTAIGEASLPGQVQRTRTFFGEPLGLAYLAFTEAWERFSYYGMTALLVLYMSQALFLPGHAEHVAGFAAFRAGLEAVFGKMSTLALASQVFGLYTGFVYFTPVFGGWIADRLDRKSTRLNSSHTVISYAVFCLKKKNISRTTVLLSLIHSDPSPTIWRDCLTPY